VRTIAGAAVACGAGAGTWADMARVYDRAGAGTTRAVTAPVR